MGPSEVWTTDDTLYRFHGSPDATNPSGGVKKMPPLPSVPEPEYESGKETASQYTVPEEDEEDPNFEAAASHVPSGNYSECSATFLMSMMTSALCNNASISVDEDGEAQVIGDPTEVFNRPCLMTRSLTSSHLF